MEKEKNNIKIAKEILQDEVLGNVESALNKMHPDYSVTWMTHTNSGNLTTKSIHDEGFIDLMKQAYSMKNRSYDIKNITATGDVVMIECIEQYEDKGRLYQTPLVLAITFKDNKIWKSRHYCDHDLSFENIKDRLEIVYK